MKRMSFQVFGTPVSRGIAIGRAVLVASSRVDVAHYFIDEAHVGDEIERLRVARDHVADELTTLRRELRSDAPAELGALLEVHLMLLHDDSLAGAIKHWIKDRRYNAEWALSAQLEVLARQFDEMEDEYLRERKADLEQVAERLLRALHRGASTVPVTASMVQDPAGAGANEDTGPRAMARSSRSTTCSRSALRSRRYSSSISSNWRASTSSCADSAHSAL